MQRGVIAGGIDPAGAQFGALDLERVRHGGKADAHGLIRNQSEEQAMDFGGPGMRVAKQVELWNIGRGFSNSHGCHVTRVQR